MKKRSIRGVIFAVVLLLVIGAVVTVYMILHPKTYSAEDFGITPFKSSVDKDGDGIDDQSDILAAVRTYLATKPKYKSKYYATGYPDDEYGVCTDVVVQGLLGAGYDLRVLVDEDVKAHRERYDIDRPDNKIDFRRVVNLKVYFENNAIVLTNDYKDIEEWQAGDIVLWAHHVGVISDKRNRKGVPYVLHHSSPSQKRYEEDILSNWGKIVGHYRISE